MPLCIVPDCRHPATAGETWSDRPLKPIRAYRKGIELSLTVRDLAVTLALCDEHAAALTSAAWDSVLTQLDEWG